MPDRVLTSHMDSLPRPEDRQARCRGFGIEPMITTVSDR